MGSKYEVQKWVMEDNVYQYVQCYYGDSFMGAVIATIKAKKVSGCIKFILR